MVITFDKEKALQADKSGNAITASGVYIGKILNAKFDKTEGGAKFIEFEFEENESGLKARFIQLFLTNKDGSMNYAAAKLHALLGLLGVKEAQIIEKEIEKVKRNTLPSVCLKPIGLILQRVNYKNAAGEDKFKFDILHFIDAKSKKTYTETEELLQAETVLRPVIDKTVTPITSANTPSYASKSYNKQTTPTEQQTGSEEENDLPFY